MKPWLSYRLVLFSIDVISMNITHNYVVSLSDLPKIKRKITTQTVTALLNNLEHEN